MITIKQILMQFKTKVKVGTIVLLLLSITACDKDSDIEDAAFQPSTDQGNNLKLTYPNGNIRYTEGDAIYGWFDGQLFGNRYWREIRGGGTGFGFSVRINIPPGTIKQEIFGDELDLNRNRLYLENSETIALYPEFWITDNDFDIYTNAYGKMTLTETDSHAIVGELNAEIINKAGVVVKISGFFWKKDANEFTIRY